MKNLHFCMKEKENLLKIKSAAIGLKLDTYRTGFVPYLYSGDVINLTERIEGKKDEILVIARIEYIFALEFIELPDPVKKQVKVSYNRKFHDHHWFFLIGLIVMELKNKSLIPFSPHEQPTKINRIINEQKNIIS